MAFFVNFGNYCFPCTPKYKQVIQLPFVDGSVANMQFPQLLTEVTEALPNGDDVPSLEDGLRVTWRALLLIAHVNPGRTLPVATFHHRLVASSNCTDSPAQTAILYIDRKLPGYSNLSLVNVIGTLGSAVLGPVNQYQTRYLQISANPILNECFAFSPNDSPTAPLQTLVPWVLVIKGTHQQSALYKASDVVRSLLSKVTTGTVSKLTPSFRHFRGGMHLSPSGQYYVTNSITVLRPGVISITGFIGFKNGRIISYLTPKLCDAHLVKTYKIFGNEVHCLIIVHLAEAGMKLSVRELDRVFSCRHNLTSEYKLRASDGQVTVHTSAEDVVAVFSEVLIRRFRVQVATELDDLNWALLQLQAKITYLQDIVFTNRENGPFPADTDITMADLKAIDYAIYPPEILQEVLQFAASRATRAELVRLINEHDTRKAALDALDGPWTEGPRRCGEALRNLLPHLEEAEKRDDAYGKDAYNELWGFAREYLQEGIFGDGVLGDDENISDVDDFAQ